MEMVFPNQANHYGTLFGGCALRLMDRAAFLAASRHARRPVVTTSLERIDFHIPVRQGQLAEVVGRVSKTGIRHFPFNDFSLYDYVLKRHQMEHLYDPLF